MSEILHCKLRHIPTTTNQALFFVSEQFKGRRKETRMKVWNVKWNKKKLASQPMLACLMLPPRFVFAAVPAASQTTENEILIVLLGVGLLLRKKKSPAKLIKKQVVVLPTTDWLLLQHGFARKLWHFHFPLANSQQPTTFPHSREPILTARTLITTVYSTIYIFHISRNSKSFPKGDIYVRVLACERTSDENFPFLDLFTLSLVERVASF